MIVEMGSVAQAGRVATLTGGEHLAAKETGKPSRRVVLDGDFETHRVEVESVSVLFELYEVRDGEVVQVPSGWSLRGATFEVEWPKDEARAALVRSHLGAPRFVYNWGLGLIKADLDAGKADPAHLALGWSLAELRQRWNHSKGQVAPWWAENSKEAYSSGLADLAQALANWKSSKARTRKGRRVGFPRFKAKARAKAAVRFSTGSMRLEDDRRHVNLPVIGTLRSKENTRRLQRHVAKGNARILSMTLSERWGRLFVSVNHAVRTPAVRPPADPDARVGVDLGLRTLATVVDSDDRITELPNPATLRATLADRRRAGRQLSRRIPGSRGHRRARAKLAKMDRRSVYLRRESYHQLTNELVSTYGKAVIEDLDLAAMKRSMGRRAFRRSVSDAALGMFRPMLEYKARRSGTVVVVVDRWFPSSQIHHGCSCRLIAPTRLAKQLVCQVTGEAVDRDHNAARNLRDWPGDASCGLVEATAPVASSSARGGGDAGSDAGTTRRRRSSRKTHAQTGGPGAVRRRTKRANKPGRNPERGAA